MDKLDSTIFSGDGADEPVRDLSNETSPHFNDVVSTRFSRRKLLQGSLGVSIAALFGGGALAGCSDDKNSATEPLLGFKAVPVGTADAIVVPEGYTAKAIVPWGTPILGGAAAFDPLTNSGQDQAGQMGSHHDGMHFFPIDTTDSWTGSSTDGLLVMNHEYVEPRFMHAAAVGQRLSRDNPTAPVNGKRPSDEVRKELNAHGVSVVRVRRQADGSWTHVAGDPLNRRITGLTEMAFSGPVRGDDSVKTTFSKDGTRTRGTLNNCAHGVTPWGTYLTCEENWASYFNYGTPAAPQQRPPEHTRYSVRGERYQWETADGGEDEFVRFDITPRAGTAEDDYRNEVNGFGWVVEIDPFAPTSTPMKRTALGRFAHEGVVFHPAVEGQPVVCYSGDDATNEFIYKFVSRNVYRKANGKAVNGALLDGGTLYVAKFNTDGTGEWLPLVHGQGALTAANGFSSQAAVLIGTRLAASAVGATPMDRPEWGAVNPKNGQVYFTLTNNSGRTQTHPANPRVKNRWGHIIRWTENGGPAATGFAWDLFLLSGPTSDSQFNGKALDADQIHNSPDGLWFDHDARLWIQTDISEGSMNTGEYAQFGNNQMLAADPETHDLRRFLTGPIGQEITGVVTTPDGRTMFINVQHPGATTTNDEFAAGPAQFKSHWPDGGNNYPRSSTVVITKNDGGKIGT